MPKKIKNWGGLVWKKCPVSMGKLCGRIAELGSDWLKDEQKVAISCCTVVQSYHGAIERKEISLA